MPDRVSAGSCQCWIVLKHATERGAWHASGRAGVRAQLALWIASATGAPAAGPQEPRARAEQPASTQPSIHVPCRAVRCPLVRPAYRPAVRPPRRRRPSGARKLGHPSARCPSSALVALGDVLLTFGRWWRLRWCCRALRSHQGPACIAADAADARHHARHPRISRPPARPSSARQARPAQHHPRHWLRTRVARAPPRAHARARTCARPPSSAPPASRARIAHAPGLRPAAFSQTA